MRMDEIGFELLPISRFSRVGIQICLKCIFAFFIQKFTCRLVIIFGSTNAPTPAGLLA